MIGKICVVFLGIGIILHLIYFVTQNALFGFLANILYLLGHGIGGINYIYQSIRRNKTRGQGDGSLVTSEDE